MRKDIFLLFGVILTVVGIIGLAIFFGNKPARSYTTSELLLPTTSVLGDRTETNILIEFSDYQCPACKMYEPTVKSLSEKYKGTLLIGYRHFPLPQHEFGQIAAQAAEASAKQGKFWEMSSYLFANQEVLSEEKINEGIDILGLQKEQFLTDYASEEVKAKIAKDKADGTRFNVQGTPTFFLNGTKISPKSPAELMILVSEEINS
jgi:protein-disulfide isomerase